MKLQKLVLDKIKALGMPEAEKYFDRKKQTLTLWVNSPDKIPAWAADKVSSEGVTGLQENGITIPPSSPRPLTNSDVTGERIAMIELRLSRLEHKTSESTLQSSVVPPQKQPNWTDPHPFGKR